MTQLFGTHTPLVPVPRLAPPPSVPALIWLLPRPTNLDAGQRQSMLGRYGLQTTIRTP